MSLSKLYDKKQLIIETAVNRFINASKRSENEIAKEVFRIVRRYNNKDLSITEKANVINEIESKIYEKIRKSKFKTSVQSFLSNVNKLEKLQKETLLKSTGIKGGKVRFNEIMKYTKNSISDNVLGKGLEANVVERFKDRLSTSLVSGADNTTIESVVGGFFKTDDTLGRLTNYVSTIARDSLNGYTGLINNEYRKEYNLTKFRYVGSLIEDSRGQCRYWVEKEIIDIKDLKEEIFTAIDGGILGGYSCSGMKDWTNIDNFTIERGGYNCRHEAIPAL